MSIGGAGPSTTEIKLVTDFQTALKNAGFAVPAVVLHADVKAEEVDENTAKLRFSFPRPGAKRIVEQDDSLLVELKGVKSDARNKLQLPNHGLQNGDVVMTNLAAHKGNYVVMNRTENDFEISIVGGSSTCLLYTSDAADE